MENNHI